MFRIVIVVVGVLSAGYCCHGASVSSVGGQQVVVLRRRQTGKGVRPEFLSVTLLPGRGMNVFQIMAYLPGKGVVPLLDSPSLQRASCLLNGKGLDRNGNESFMMGGALLFPFANRILGPATSDGKYVLVAWHGRTVRLLANWTGSRPGDPPQALHGQLLMARADRIEITNHRDNAVATATYRMPAQDNWFSSNLLTIRVILRPQKIYIEVTAKNIGSQKEPIGIGWHPYFLLPSGNRTMARLHLPATMRVVVNNPEDLLPTGKLLPVRGTAYNFTPVGGCPLAKPLNDAFMQLSHTWRGHSIASISDVESGYGLQVTAMTRSVKTMLVYSPGGRPLIVLEPQFNNADPFGEEWNGNDNGMVTLRPGKAVSWKTQLSLFQPKKLYSAICSTQ